MKIGEVSVNKEAIKKMTISKFRKAFSNPAFRFGCSLDEAYYKITGKRASSSEKDKKATGPVDDK